jgi:NAD dependent epimerase/dehydratase family enzyme
MRSPADSQHQESPGCSSESLYLEGDPTQKGPWQERVADQDVVINLAGASIFRRWTDSAKKLIWDSRIQTTKNLVEALAARKDKETYLLSTSAVGYYGFHEDEVLDEGSLPGQGFLPDLSKEWESAALKREQGARDPHAIRDCAGKARRSIAANDPCVQVVDGEPPGKRESVVFMDS